METGYYYGKWSVFGGTDLGNGLITYIYVIDNEKGTSFSRDNDGNEFKSREDAYNFIKKKYGCIEKFELEEELFLI